MSHRQSLLAGELAENKGLGPPGPGQGSTGGEVEWPGKPQGSQRRQHKCLCAQDSAHGAPSDIHNLLRNARGIVHQPFYQPVCTLWEL